MLHKSCQLQHRKLLEKYGGGKDLPKIVDFFKNNQVEPNTKNGYELMKKAFKKFKYQIVWDKGWLEPYVLEETSTVLRGERSRKAPYLLDKHLIGIFAK